MEIYRKMKASGLYDPIWVVVYRQITQSAVPVVMRHSREQAREYARRANRERILGEGRYSARKYVDAVQELPV